MLVATALLAPSTGRWCAERAAIALRIGEDGSAWTGVLPMLLGMVGELSYGWPVAVVALGTVPLLALGRTPGETWARSAARRPDPWSRRLATACARTAPALAFLFSWILAHPLAVLFAVGTTLAWLGVGMNHAIRRKPPSA